MLPAFFRTFMLTITNPITIMAFGPVFVAANAVVEEGNLAASLGSHRRRVCRFGVLVLDRCAAASIWAAIT